MALPSFDFSDKAQVKVFLAVIAGLIVTLLLFIWLTIQNDREVRQNREWYVSQLDYKFSAIIDTIYDLHHRDEGIVYFVVRSGKAEEHKEDSLNVTMAKSLRFITKGYNGQLTLVIQSWRDYRNGDSLLVNTLGNEILIFRERQRIGVQKITSILR